MSDLVERLREGTTIRLSETSSTYTPPPKLQTEAAARIEALERERAALRDERDSLSSIVSSGIDDVAGAALDDAESALAASQAEASRLREALKLCQSALEMMVGPEAVRASTVMHAWAHGVEAEAVARAALEKP